MNAHRTHCCACLLSPYLTGARGRATQPISRIIHCSTFGGGPEHTLRVAESLSLPIRLALAGHCGILCQTGVIFVFSFRISSISSILSFSTFNTIPNHNSLIPYIWNMDIRNIPASNPSSTIALTPRHSPYLSHASLQTA